MRVNHYHASWWAQDHNRAYWNEKFGSKRSFDQDWNKGFKNELIIVSFSKLYDLKRLGINTLGIHTDAPMLTEPPGHENRFPYVAEYTPLKLSHYLNPSPETYMDIAFSKDYEDICEKTAREMVAPYANDPMILGPRTRCMSIYI